MRHAGICDGKVTRGELTREEIMAFVRGGAAGQVLWLDIENPDDSDWELLRDGFRFHPLAIEDAKDRAEMAKMDVYPEADGRPGFVYLSLRVWRGGDDATADLNDVTQEIDVFLGANYIITLHPEGCSTVALVRSRWETHPDRLPEARHSPAYLLHLILDAAVDECFPAMDQIDREIDAVETAIYEDTSATGDAAHVKPALLLRKRLLLLRQTVTPLRDVVNQILRTDDPIFPTGLRVYFQDVYDHALRLVEAVDLHRDILSGVLEAVMAQTSNRLNVVMKKMTGISTILMSAALISGIYGMNFANMPELKAPNGYYLALAGMAGVSVVLALIFKRIGWF
jgi:magnesium transporter